MLTPEEIEQRARLIEDSRYEYKGVSKNKFTINVDDLAKEISAFANTGGGYILIGLEDNGEITGIGNRAQADELVGKASEACRQNVEPPLPAIIQTVEVQGKSVLVIEVPAFSTNRPHLVSGRAYLRDANRSRPATRDELIRLLQSENYHYDEQVVSGSNFNDLDLSAVQSFLKTAYDVPVTAALEQHYLKALQCIDNNGTPTVSGILFFGCDPNRWLQDAHISAVRFRGTTMADFLDRKEIGGRLFDQVNAAMAFLTTHVPEPARIQGWIREEHGIPVGTLREALLNAIAHRDYRVASQICIFVFDNRVEFINPGVLLNRLTLESIRIGGIKQFRNPAIVSILARNFRRENLGRGVPEMIAMMRERGLPEPEFDLPGGHFRVVLRAWKEQEK